MASLVMEEEKSLKEKISALDKLSSALNKKAGKTVVGRIGNNEEIAEKLRIKFIPSKCEEFNELTGGGYPRGRTTLIAGQPDSGKTSRLLEDIGYNMKDPNYTCLWVESEGSLEINYLEKTFGIDPDRFYYLEVEREGAAETCLDRIESYLALGNALDMVVINSLKCLVPKREMTDSFGDSQVGLQARMNNKMQRKFTSLISEANLAYVLVTHLHSIIGSMSRDPLTISGGLGIQFGAAITLDFRKRSMQDSDPIDRSEGLKINVTQKKNHCTPGRNIYLKTDYFVVFGEGTEQALPLIDKATDQGVLTKSGSWLYWYEEDGETKRYAWQGKQKCRDFLKENPDVLEELKSLVAPEKLESLSSVEVASIKHAEEEVESELANIVEDSASQDK